MPQTTKTATIHDELKDLQNELSFEMLLLDDQSNLRILQNALAMAKALSSIPCDMRGMAPIELRTDMSQFSQKAKIQRS